jgi:hypothetical protein
VALDSMKAHDFHGAFKACKKLRESCNLPMETALEEMAGKIKLSKHFLLFFQSAGTFR